MENDKKTRHIFEWFAKLKQDRRFLVALDRVKLLLYVLIIYLFLTLLHIGCPIKFITGISCPGCGMTRAALAVLQLHFLTAFYYHPLFILTPFMLLLFVMEAYLRPIVLRTAWILVILSFLTVYMIRLFILPNSVISIDIQDGLMLKLIHKICVGGLL